jgi:hypothetical protein
MEGVSNIWIDQGLEKGRNCMKNMLIDALKIKFNNVSQPIGNFIQSIKDEEMLQRLHREILLCNNMYEFQHRLETIRVS